MKEVYMFWKRKECGCEKELSKVKQDLAVLSTQFMMMTTNMNSLRGLVNKRLRGIVDAEIESSTTMDLESVRRAFGGELPFELVREEINKKQRELNS